MLFNNSPLLGLRTTFFIIISIVVMVVDHRHHELGTIRGLLSDAAVPFEYTVNWPVEVVEWVKNSFSSQHELITENTHLRMRNLLLQAKVQKILALQNENKSLRALLQSSTQVTGNVEVAQILAVTMDSYVAQAIVNKGKKDKVYVGQPVLGANGVMGQIIRVNNLTSRMMLITDTRSAIPVTDQRTGLRAIVIGTGPHRPLKLINIPETVDIQVGDKLSTSGLGLRYPVGYPVGIVTKVHQQPGEQFATIVVSPTAHLYRDQQVLLVWHKQAALLNEAKSELKAMKAEDQNIHQHNPVKVSHGR